VGVGVHAQDPPKVGECVLDCCYQGETILDV